MRELLNQINKYVQNPALNSETAVTVAVVATVLIAIIYCFFGYRSIRLIAGIIGFLLGAGLGSMLADRLKLTSPLDIVAICGCAIVLALLGSLVYRAGIFIAVLASVWGVVWSILSGYTTIEPVFTVLIGLVAGVLLAILSMIYLRPMIIVSTALGGGMMFSDLIFEHLVHVRWSTSAETMIRLGTGLILAVIGMIFQFVTTREE